MEEENQATNAAEKTRVEAEEPGGSGIPGDTTIDDEPKHGPRKTRRPGGKRGLSLPRRFRKKRPGAPAGIEPEELPAAPTTAGAVRISCIDYGPDQHHSQEVHDLAAFIEAHRPPWSAVRWINVDGLSDLGAIRAVAEKYRLHPLAVEDVLHIPQRPKVQAYEEDGGYQARLFIIARELELRGNMLHAEQVSIFVGHKTVLTFQES